MLELCFPRLRRFRGLAFLTIQVTLALCGLMTAQSTLGTGVIRGIVSDERNIAIPGAKVTLTNRETGAVVELETSATGAYFSGPLQPGNYIVKFEMKAFQKVEVPAVTRVGRSTSLLVTLRVSAEHPSVEVQPQASSLLTDQFAVQTVLSGDDIEFLPLNGRSPFDLGQLEPATQYLNDGVIFPQKDNFNSPVVQGHPGRGVRIEVDGVDVSDETTGATMQNVPASAIQEFAISQSSHDLSTELTSSGAVTIATRSSGNDLHGEAIGSYSGERFSSGLPGLKRPPFGRQQYGARAGGALMKNELFWFLDVERSKQDLTAPEPFASPFNTLSASLSEPFREWQADGRLDWQVHNNAHAFYRFGFDESREISPYGAFSSLQAIKNETHTPSHTLGYDFTKGKFTHSLRFEYLKFHDGVGDESGAIGAGIENPIPGLGINIGAAVLGSCAFTGGGAYCGGPALIAPEARFQSDAQLRYEGTRLVNSHAFRFGATYNRIMAGGWAPFGVNPQVGATSVCLPGTATSNCETSADPTAYAADFVTLGNGIGFATTQSAFGYPGGQLGPDNRIEAYAGDTWKKRNVSVTYGIQYVRDTNRVDSNLGPELSLDLWAPGIGGQVRNPNSNIAPQFGFAWDTNGNGKSVFRAGGGLYYANSLWSNMVADSAARHRNGSLSYAPEVCSYGVPSIFTWPTAPGPVGSAVAGGAGVVVGTSQVKPTFCGGTIGAVASNVLALSNAFQSAAATNALTQPNPNYVATSLSATNVNGLDVFDPNYRTPRSWQANVGFQHEISPGTMFSVDVIRNVGEHFLMAIDRNHSGAARSFNQGYAVAARDAAQLANGCPAGIGEAGCMIAHLGEANAQAAYSAAGLDSNSAVTGGGPCNFCAFPGVTPNGQNYTGAAAGNGALGTLDMLEPAGHSVYTALQFKLVDKLVHPYPGIEAANLQLSYSFSKYTSPVSDQDVIGVPMNNDNPLEFKGPNGMDRTHQVSFSSTLDLPRSIRISAIGHFYSPIPQNLELPQLTNGGEIYATDWLGSGLGSGAAPEPLPGTQLGQFNRRIDNSGLQNLISKYNTHYAGSLTPAGHCLVGDQFCPGLVSIPVMTQSDMNTLGWVMPQVPSLPFGGMDYLWLKTIDVKAAWTFKIRDRITIEPSASVYNVFNFANSFAPGQVPSASLMPGGPNNTLSPTSVAGQINSTLTPFRNTLQSGMYALGAPRMAEFRLKIEF